ncbi:MAG: hypothetical protein JST59_20715 [Actinobacteria bacterium]|nr:hypothetical protein [Actinomycetota bacterium]
MPLSKADEERVEGELAGMIEELRINPNQEKEDRIGVQISTMPEEEREFVPTALLRFVAVERRGEQLPEPAPFSGPVPVRRKRFAWTLRPPKG